MVVNEVQHLDDGGTSETPMFVASDGSREETETVVKAIYGEDVSLVSRGVEQAIPQRRKASMGYTGRWRSSYDPKGPKRTDDGLVIQ